MTSKLIVLACIVAVSQARFIENERPLESFRILGGSDAQPGEFPYQVSLTVITRFPDRFIHYCGGSIINKQWILTAGHCLELIREFSYFTFAVRAGKHNLDIAEPTQQLVFIESYFIHEKFNYTAGPGPHNIGLIKLKTDVEFNEHVAPISLPKKDAESMGTVTLSGWGLISDNGMEEDEKSSSILQKADLEIIDYETCKQALPMSAEGDDLQIRTSLVTETNVCTVPLTEGVGGCSGDSGSGLISKDKNGKTEVVGIASWVRRSCGRKDVPTVYTKVSSYIDWIENIMVNYKM